METYNKVINGIEVIIILVRKGQKPDKSIIRKLRREYKFSPTMYLSDELDREACEETIKELGLNPDDYKRYQEFHNGSVA